MCDNLCFVEAVFLYCFWKENSLLNLFVSLSVFLILCHLILALAINRM